MRANIFYGVTASLIFAIALPSQRALAYNIDGSGSSGAPFSPVVMYLFNENSGTTVHDTSGVGTAINLTIADPTQVIWPGTPAGGGLQFIGNSAAQSSGAATKLINACSATNEITVEAWISEDIQELVYDVIGPARIVSLSNGVTTPEGFFFGEDYVGGFQYGLYSGTTSYVANGKTAGQGTIVHAACGTSTSANATDQGCAAVTNADADPTSVSGLRHIYLTKDQLGNGSIYMTDASGVPAQLVSGNVFTNAGTNFANWATAGTNFKFAVGNDNNYTAADPLLSTLIQSTEVSNQTIETKPWRGTIYFLAVYCNAMSGSQILGTLSPTNWIAQEVGTVTVNPAAAITPAQQLAQLIYKRIGGVTLPIDSSTIASMTTALNSGGGMDTEASRMAAADIAANLPGFYNRTLKDFAKPYTNQGGVISGTPLNDMVASFIGVARDGIDARQLLQGNFFYEGDVTKAGVPTDLVNDILTSNNHYQALEDGVAGMPYDLSYVLKQVPSQYYLQPLSTNTATNFTGANTVPAAQLDYGGVLTSRAFASAYLSNGTNRRAIEYTFQDFMCRTMTQWANAAAGDQFVGVDVDRFPEGNHTEYQTTCRSCHGQMDGMRPAFARLTFETNFLKHGAVIPADTTDEDPNDANNETSVSVMNQGICNPLTYTGSNCAPQDAINPTISGKYTKNSYVFPQGYIVTNTGWTNLATNGTNGTFFGWANNSSGAPITGQGVNQFGAMIANSQAYAACMVQTTFNTVCNRPAQSFDAAVLQRVTTDFTTSSIDNYNLKKLFERMTVQPECLGQ